MKFKKRYLLILISLIIMCLLGSFLSMFNIGLWIVLVLISIPALIYAFYYGIKDYNRSFVKPSKKKIKKPILNKLSKKIVFEFSEAIGSSSLLLGKSFSEVSKELERKYISELMKKTRYKGSYNVIVLNLKKDPSEDRTRLSLNSTYI